MQWPRLPQATQISQTGSCARSTGTNRWVPTQAWLKPPIRAQYSVPLCALQAGACCCIAQMIMNGGVVQDRSNPDKLFAASATKPGLWTFDISAGAWTCVVGDQAVCTAAAHLEKSCLQQLSSYQPAGAWLMPSFSSRPAPLQRRCSANLGLSGDTSDQVQTPACSSKTS